MEKPCQQVFEIGAPNFGNRPNLQSKLTRFFQIQNPNFGNRPGLSSKPENMVSPCRLVRSSVSRAPAVAWSRAWGIAKNTVLNEIWWRCLVHRGIFGRACRSTGRTFGGMAWRAVFRSVGIAGRRPGRASAALRTGRRGFTVSPVPHLHGTVCKTVDRVFPCLYLCNQSGANRLSNNPLKGVSP